MSHVALLKRRGGEEQRSLHPADSAVPTWLSRSSAPCAAGAPVALPDGSEGVGVARLGWCLSPGNFGNRTGLLTAVSDWQELYSAHFPCDDAGEW